MKRFGAVVAACCFFTVSALARDNSALDQQIKGKIRNFQGRVTLYATNLGTGRSYGIEPDAPVRTASTIKLPIMVECFFEAEQGKLNWDELSTLTENEIVSGTGILQDLSPGDKLPVRDLMHLMIVVSDNTATNLILNRITGDAVNAKMAQLGFSQTRVMRKILGDGNQLKSQPSGITQEGAKPENRKWGIGRSSPHEMVDILERLYRGELVSKTASAEMLAVLKHQQDHNGIGRDLKDITIASKAGALDHLRSDVGIVYSQHGPIAMAITVDGMPEINYTVDNPGDLLISSLSQILIDGLGSTTAEK